jgi:hypothetical protein
MIPSQLVTQFTEGTKTLDIMGYVAWWTVKNVSIVREQLIQVLKGCGIDEKFARSHNYRAAFIRSLRELEANRIIRPVEENSGAMVYQFTAENQVEGNDEVKLEYSPETLVTIDKGIYRKTQDISQAITGREDIKEKLVALFEEKKDKYHSSDITRLIKRIFAERADIVSLRETGGVYYIPTEFESVLHAVSQFVNNIGSSSFEFFPLPDVEACRNAVAYAVDNEMRVDLEKMEEEAKLVESGEKEVTQRWRNHRIKTLDKFTQRFTRYKAVLTEATQKDLTDNYESIKESILKPRVLDLE